MEGRYIDRAQRHTGNRASLASLVLVLLVFIGTGLTSAANAQAQVDDLRQPRILVELGGHAAAIRRIDVARDRDLVVTASDDKTARVWRWSTRKLLQVLRPRVGDDAVGRLYGVSIHPYEDVVAVAGSTAPANGAHRILLFSMSTGQLASSFDARGGDIKKLAWTPDGALLIATYAGQSGLRAFDRTGRMVFEQSFKALSYGLDVARDGRIAASTLDGRIFLFSYRGGKISADGEIRSSGSGPISVAFSPDSRQLAVGHFGTQANRDGPQIFDVATRKRQHQLSIPPVKAGNLMAVTWSADGSRLIASGTAYNAQIQFLGFVFDAVSGKLISQHVMGSDSIQDMRPAGASSIAFASFSGAWGSVDLATGVTSSTGATLASFRGARTLKVSADARQVGFAFDNGRSQAWFDLNTRLVKLGAAPAHLKPPAVDAERLRGAVWEDTAKPIVNGRSPPVDKDEVGRALTLVNEQGDAVFGTSKGLFRIAANGSVQWRLRTGSEVRAVNVSGNGQVIVTAESDGTIRWRRAQNGQLMMSALVRQDGQWVVWTPAGQFDASAGADRIVGWAVNRADLASADFFSLNRFREAFNNPLVIDNVLGKPPVKVGVAPIATPALTISAIDKVRFPPVLSAVNLSALSAGQPQVSIPFVLRAEGRPSVEVRVDGRPAQAARIELPARFDGNARAIAHLPTPGAGSVIQIIARDQFGISEPLGFKIAPHSALANVQSVDSVPPVSAVQTLNPGLPVVDLQAARRQRIEQAITQDNVALPPSPVMSPASPPSGSAPVQPNNQSQITPAVAGQGTAVARPRLFVLSIGISNYQKPQYKLGLAAKDSRDFVSTVNLQKGIYYGQVFTRSLVDGQATRAKILDGLQWLSRSVGPSDVGMLFIAGHGVNAPDGQYYFIPYEGDHESLAATGVPEQAIRDTLGRMRGKALFFVDTCYAGNALGNFQAFSRELARMANDLAASENGVIVFASSSGRQLSEENDVWGNGAFTKAVIAGLSGGADLTRSGSITYKGLDFYVSDQVSRLTDGRQTPVTISPIGVPDFAIARASII